MKGKRRTTEQYKLELKEVNKKNNTNIRLKDGVEYINSQTKIIHICTCGKEWNVKPNHIIDNKAKSCGLCYSFAQWGIDNYGKDFLDKYWDWEKNNNLGIDPWKISYSSIKPKVWIKCQVRDYHGSYDTICNSFVNGHRCGYCKGGRIVHQKDSFGQYLINTYGENALKLYWDYEKNTIDPFLLKTQAHKIVYIYCQEKDYHGSYPVLCDNFINGNRCSYCNSRSNNRIHPLDSIGKILEDKGLLHLWSDKNEKSPFKYSPGSSQKHVYWKCPESKHDDYKRSIYESKDANFRCPECQYSKGEERISNCLISKSFIKIDQDDFNQLLNEDKFNKDYYIPQMKFDGLVGINNGLLSYDFYIPKYNLIIEYDGEYHFRLIKYKNESMEDAKNRFNKQQIHDRMKSKYALDNDMDLLRIPYWEFDNLEEILEREVFNK